MPRGPLFAAGAAFALGVAVTAAGAPPAGVLATGAAALGFIAWRLGRARPSPAAAAPDPRGIDQRLDLAIRAAGLGFWELDMETRALVCDTRARELFGLPNVPDLVERDWVDRLHGEDRLHAFEGAHASLERSGTSATEYRITLPDGGTRWVEDIAVVHATPDGRRRLVGLVRDATYRRLASDALRSDRAEAQALAEQKARFLAVMSHEIRTPLTSILGMLELLTEEPDADKQREQLAIARGSARSLLAILNDVLAFSKLEVGMYRLAMEPTRPRQLLAELIDLLAPRAEEKGITLGWTMAPEVPEWVVVDPTRLRQVLLNVLSNAVKFTDVGEVRARVAVRPAHEPGKLQLRVEVQDSGVGISLELITRVFDSFVRDESSDRAHEGTGLGLAIAKQLVDLMGGAITLQSTPGIGTVAVFDVPVEPLVSPPQTAEEVDDGPSAPMRILVAEDNSTNQYLVRALLEREGHQVTTVNNGAEAVGAAESGQFDVILMDVQMPVLDGASAARAIRDSGGPGAETPIIALTANALAGDRSSYLASGMTDYVSKPIEIAALNLALARAARGRRDWMEDRRCRAASG